MIIEHEILDQALDDPMAVTLVAGVCADRERFIRACEHHLSKGYCRLWLVSEVGRQEVPHWDRKRVLADDSQWGGPLSLPRYELETTDVGAEYLFGPGDA